jgi:hypothetical protein
LGFWTLIAKINLVRLILLLGQVSRLTCPLFVSDGRTVLRSG